MFIHTMLKLFNTLYPFVHLFGGLLMGNGVSLTIILPVEPGINAPKARSTVVHHIVLCLNRRPSTFAASGPTW